MNMAEQSYLFKRTT